jgi:hypothetical protein
MLAKLSPTIQTSETITDQSNSVITRMRFVSKCGCIWFGKFVSPVPPKVEEMPTELSATFICPHNRGVEPKIKTYLRLGRDRTNHDVVYEEKGEMFSQ